MTRFVLPRVPITTTATVSDAPGGVTSGLYRWATVTSSSPLRIRLDGDATELPLRPASMIDPRGLTLGTRVFVLFFGRRLIVLGAASGGQHGWRYIGDPGEPAFENGWLNYAGGHRAARFSQEGRWVHLRGLVKSGSVGTIFTMPEDLRPTADEVFTCWSSTGTARVDVTSSGEVNLVTYGTGGTSSFVSLAQVFWPLD